MRPNVAFDISATEIETDKYHRTGDFPGYMEGGAGDRAVLKYPEMGDLRSRDHLVFQITALVEKYNP